MRGHIDLETSEVSRTRENHVFRPCTNSVDFPVLVDQKYLNGVISQEEVFESTLIEHRKDLE